LKITKKTSTTNRLEIIITSFIIRQPFFRAIQLTFYWKFFLFLQLKKRLQ